MKTPLQQNLFQDVITYLQDQDIEAPSEGQIQQLCQNFLSQKNILLPKPELKHIIDQVTFSVIGLGPLEFLLRDKSISEIMVNGPDSIFVEQNGVLKKSKWTFISEEQLLQIINRIVGKIGRRIDESQPLVDARLLDGSRVNAIIPPLSLTGPVLTIRKFPEKAFTMSDMLKNNSLTQEMADFLQKAIDDKENILIVGGTGAGKTSTLNACASGIPDKERLITIEDAAEIRITHPHCISLESRAANIEGRGAIPIRTLLKNALRMRPDRIVVGEIRGGEAIDMLQAMNTGHRGSLTTLHANSPLESLFRLETMVLMGEIDLPLTAIRPQIIQGIDLIVQQSRLNTGERKITHISRVNKKSTQEYGVTDLFVYENNKFKKC